MGRPPALPTRPQRSAEELRALGRESRRQREVFFGTFERSEFGDWQRTETRSWWNLLLIPFVPLVLVIGLVGRAVVVTVKKLRGSSDE